MAKASKCEKKMTEDFIVDLPDLGIKLNTFDPNIDPIISNWLHRDKIWEPMMTQLLLEDFKTNKWFLDVGANIGYYTVLALKEGLNTVSVEPKPENFEKLSYNVQQNIHFSEGGENEDNDWEFHARKKFDGRRQTAVLHRRAVSNEGEYLTLSADPHNSGDIRTSHPEDTDRLELEARVIRLDEVCNVEEEAILKLDIQGYEHDAVLGLTSKPSIIYTEIEPPLLVLNGTSVLSYMYWFHYKGYKQYTVIDEVNKKYLDFTFSKALDFLIDNKETYPGHFNVRIS